MKIIRQQNFIWWLQETLTEINIATLLKAILQELKYLCIGNNMYPSFFSSITYGQWYRTHPAFNMPTKNAAHILSNRFNEHYWKHKYTLFWYTINNYPTHKLHIWGTYDQILRSPSTSPVTWCSRTYPLPELWILTYKMNTEKVSW